MIDLVSLARQLREHAGETPPTDLAIFLPAGEGMTDGALERLSTLCELLADLPVLVVIHPLRPSDA